MGGPRVQGAWRLGLLLLAWAAGLAVQLQQATLAPQAFSAAALVAGALLLAAGAWRRWLAALLAGAFILAWAGTDLRAQHRLSQRLDPALEGADLWVTGVVATLPQVGAAGTRFVFEVQQAQRDGQPVTLPPRLSLGWYRGLHDDSLLAGPQATLRAGQRWQLPLRLRLPHGVRNPEGFDAELWMFEQDLGAQGHVRSAADRPPPRLLGDDGGHPVERWRQRLRDAIDARVPDPHAAGVLAALVVGDQAAIEREDWELFRRTGVAHLMSISGLHITMFAWLAGGLIGAAWRRSPRLALAWPAPLAARWGGLAVAAAYALLAGWGVPAQRTVAMLAGVALLRSAGLRWPPLLVLAAAGAAVTLMDPWALLQPGFWLSFAAVGLLMLSDTPADAPAPVAPGLARRALAALRHHLGAQLVATLGLAPLAMLFFQQVSVVGFVANLVAIPLVTLVITPLALTGALWGALWPLCAGLLQGLLAGLAWLGSLPAAVWTAAAAPAWGVACGLLGAVLLVTPLPWRLRALGLPLLLPLLAPAMPRPAPGQFELVAVDVGQGTAALVRTREHLLVFDAGPQYSRESDAGQRVLLPLLRARGEARIDTLVLSHRDSDHVGGAGALLATLPVRQLLHSLPDDHALLAADAPPRQRCAAGQRWQWDGVDFQVLHPLADAAPAVKPNAVSCVLRVGDGQGRAALLTADIEAAQEAALAAQHGPALRAQVLMVPHHGSRTSSSAALLDTVRPQLAFVQAGYRSRFGHPAPDVVARYADRGITLVRSDRCGAWTWRDGASWCERRRQPRYWQAQAPVDSPPTVPSAGAVVAKPLVAGETTR